MTIGGVPATVLSTLPCTIIVQVPPNVTGGPIAVTSPLGTGTSAQTFNVFGFTLGATNPAILIGATLQFVASINGCQSSQIIWSVNGVVGGNADIGTISTTGLYTAPKLVPNPATVTIRAASGGCPSLFADRALTVVNELLGFVYAHASANHGPAVPVFVSSTIIQSASVGLGKPSLVLTSGSIVASASVAKAPVIASMKPNTAAKGSNFTLTITGQNLGGAFALAFALSNGMDVAVTATNVTVNPTGDTLTANVSILSTAASGARTVVVETPLVNSTGAATSADTFTVTP